MSAASKPPSSATAPGGWLFGPVSDLLFGCGLAYVAVFVLHCIAGARLREWVPFALLPIATLLVSTPHYGATLIRVYEDRQERRLQARFAIWATAALCLALWLGLSGSAAFLLLRGGTWRAVAPALLLILSQTLWFVVPALARNWQIAQGVELLGLGEAQYAFLWIALAHAAQYVWIAASYEEARERDFSVSRFYARALAAGSTAWTLPALVFAPGVLGALPFDAGLGMLVAALVNLHHFMLDGVIWKLRDARVARVLRLESNAKPLPIAVDPRRGAKRALVGVLGAASLGVSLLGAFEMDRGVGAGFARGDVRRLEAADQRLRWIGRASPQVRTRIGLLELRAGRLDAAEHDFDASLALHPTASAWIAKGYVAAKRANFAGALQSYDRALELDPRSLEALYQSAYALLELGRREEARVRLERGLAIEPDNAKLRGLLDSAR